MSINYELAKREGPKLKAALTRAQKRPVGTRYAAVFFACKTAVKAWEVWGAWPDNWSLWQRALDDAACQHNRVHRVEEWVMPSVRLETL